MPFGKRKRPSVKVKRLAILCGRFPARRPGLPAHPGLARNIPLGIPITLARGVAGQRPLAKGHSYSCSGSSLPPPLLLVKVREATLELTPSLMAMAFTVVVAFRVKGSV